MKRGTWVVMIVGPTETPEVMGPYRKRETAEADADRWNAANPHDQEDGDQYTAYAVPVTPFRTDT